jgi:hypothetical protein
MLPFDELYSVMTWGWKNSTIPKYWQVRTMAKPKGGTKYPQRKQQVQKAGALLPLLYSFFG